MGIYVFKLLAASQRLSDVPDGQLNSDLQEKPCSAVNEAKNVDSLGGATSPVLFCTELRPFSPKLQRQLRTEW